MITRWRLTRVYFKTTEEHAKADIIKMYFCMLTMIFDKRRRTLGDAVFCRKESFLEKPLEDGAHRWPVDQLQHEQVRLRGNVKTRRK